LAIGSLIGFHLARDETAAVSITERMGQTRSLLVVEELLEALADPRFNVRFEAILAIAHTRSDPRLLQALGEVLAGDDPALGVVAAWALGRIGDPHALPYLRAGFDSRYRSIRVHCSRSLGMLQDQESASILAERLKQESDPGLQLAYASTLGKLRAVESASQIIALLQARENPGARLELALALARMIGDEHFFIRLARQVRVEASTPLSQAVSTAYKKLGKHSLQDSVDPALWNECAVAFSRSDFPLGVSKLSDLLAGVPAGKLQPLESLAFGECISRLAEYGDARIEYVLLALHCLYSLSLE
jgi:HEAT repeat protein